MRLILLFVFMPLIELMILLKLADLISGTWTFLLVVVTGVIGASLARRQGWSVIRKLQHEVGSGQLPTTTLVDALMIFIAGALLITPGILTDVFGFSLLIPFMRNVYRRKLMEWFRAHATVTTFTSTGEARGPWQAPFQDPHRFERGEVIDSYVVQDNREKEKDES